MTRILVTGGTGQVGSEMRRLDWPQGVTIDAPGRSLLDLASGQSVAALFAANRYDAIVNCAAYTAVDQAEDEVGLAFLANAQGPAFLADAARVAGIPLIHVSTDYVFDGSADGFYQEDDVTAPLGVYGASKRAGELAVLSGAQRALILRTAWVVSAHGKNFLKTMLRLGAANPKLRVIDDQHGCPTAAADIAAALKVIVLRMIADPDAPTGIHHFVNAGEASWHGLAREIFRLSAAAGGRAPEVEAITSADYPTRVRRPLNSRLGCARLARGYAITARPWQQATADIVHELLGSKA
ncbi:MAG: NAD(P)-dependent oxidoreductase [Sphingomonas bacterium]|nr:NAD(P)-dependent oxidoreductase [Sphingomonas bacterium]